MSARTLTPERIDAWMTWKREERAAAVLLEGIRRAAARGADAVLVPLDLAQRAGVPTDRLDRSRRRGYRRTVLEMPLARRVAHEQHVATRARRPR